MAKINKEGNFNKFAFGKMTLCGVVIGIYIIYIMYVYPPLHGTKSVEKISTTCTHIQCLVHTIFISFGCSFSDSVQLCQKNATEDEIMLAIANCLKNVPYRKGGGGPATEGRRMVGRETVEWTDRVKPIKDLVFHTIGGRCTIKPLCLVSCRSR